MLLTKIHEASGDLFELVYHDWFDRLNEWCATLDVNISVASEGGNNQILVYSDGVIFIYGDKLCTKLILKESDFRVPSLGREEAWRDILWHLNAEWKGEFADLTLVLIWCQIQQRHINSCHYCIATEVFLLFVA